MIVHGAGLASQPPYRLGMDRRRFLLTSLAGVLAAPLGAGGQQTKVYRIGFLSASSATAASRLVEQFQQGLRELGYTEGQNVRTV